MTDRYLVKRASAECPWVKRVYSATCGFVHLSAKHMAFTCGEVNKDARTIEVCISGRDGEIDDTFRIEAIAGMSEITNEILRYALGWAHTKEIKAAPSS